jgi:hypothetical protein
MFAKQKAPAVRWKNAQFHRDAHAGWEAADAAGFDLDTPDATARLVLADWCAEHGFPAAEACERDTARHLSAAVGIRGYWRRCLRTLADRFTRDMIQTNIEWCRPGEVGWSTDAVTMFQVRDRDRAIIAATKHTPTGGRVFGAREHTHVVHGARHRSGVPFDPAWVVKADWADGREFLRVHLDTGDPAAPRLSLDCFYWRFLLGYFPHAQWRSPERGYSAVSLWEAGDVVAVVMPLS